ncbi:sugar porter family MFS transporter [Segniliparus rugosus]|uniref:Sugar porter (SP) family MFS transporter n=1 Tax=Segniliparus rugosus (strain ATCC BAA-974 / DSM 45345 / CCUG 50838 / CIP 108380 / JCM 13579 / CDC 945) TaxID=679197 RepID=E5XUT9_SEGRC|nr:sugar porter family MFS transporter [Segniliparus rugosus]EFV11927.1 sugar porter (SP) family MFS transporter [Segniliparus rugosus ATCC BAA-974]
MVSQLTPGRHAAEPPRPPLVKVLFVSASAAMSGFLFGYDTAVINGAVSGVKSYFAIDAFAVGAIVSTALLGCAAGAMGAGRLAEQLGRRTVMRVAALLFLVSALGSMFPGTVWLLAFWRVLGGTAIGVASVIGPLYIAEVSPPAYRGRLSSLQQLAIVVGIAVSQLVNYLIAAAAGGSVRNALSGIEAWQWMLGACSIPALVYFLLASTIPESPRFLVANGQDERAREVFAELEGPQVDVEARVREVRSAIAADHKPSFRDLIGGTFILPLVVWVGIGMAVFQQLVGINVVFYYSATLWQSVGSNQSDSLLRSFSTAVINIVGTFIAIALIDKIGRKALLLVGSAGMAVALGAEAWAFSRLGVQDGHDFLPREAGLTALVAAHVFVFFFALSWGVVLWVLLGEMFPARIRAAAVSLATACNWIANWLITISFPSLSAWNLSLTYVGYALFAAVSFVFVQFLVRETKGRTLEEA